MDVPVIESLTSIDLSRETWLDLTVNVVPLAILLFMDVLFWVLNPWGWEPLLIVVSHFLVLFPFALLALVTYVSGTAIQRDDAEMAGDD